MVRGAMRERDAAVLNAHQQRDMILAVQRELDAARQQRDAAVLEAHSRLLDSPQYSELTVGREPAAARAICRPGARSGTRRLE